MNLTPEQLRKGVAKVRREAKARADAAMHHDQLWKARFPKLEQEYLAAHPHLAKHKHCGLCPDTVDRPRRKVTLPNGHVLFTTWYKVPTTGADAVKALKEAKWMNEQARKHGSGWQLKAA